MQKYLSLALACMLVFGLMSFAQAETDDYVLTAEMVDGSIEISLKNNSDALITVSDVEMAATVKPEGVDPLSWGRDVLDPKAGDELLDGKDELDIQAGGEVVIAVVAPGAPDTWRPNNAADHTLHLNIWVKIGDSFHNLGEVNIELKPDLPELELAIGTHSPTQHSPIEDIVLTLTNNTEEKVTISGPVVIQGYGHWSVEKGEERVRVDLAAGDPIEIPAGETADIAILKPGGPTSWRNFWSPQILDLQVWIHVADKGWFHDVTEHVIAGELVMDIHDGTADFVTDNQDGTATLIVTVKDAVYKTGIVWDEDAKEWIEDKSTTVLDPVSGLGKENFAVLERIKDGGERVRGEVLSAKETGTPGEYEIVWSFENGEHEIFVQTSVGDDVMGYLGDPETETLTFKAEISSIKPIASTLDEESGKYEAKLEFPDADISFRADSEITADLSLRRKGSSLNPAPEGAKPAGIFMDINVVSGDLEDSEITLEVKYSLDDIPVGMNENNLRLFRFNEDKDAWEELPDQEVDTDAKVIRVQLQGFSEFGVFEVEPATEELPATGAPMQPLLYLGMLFLLGGIVLITRKQPA